jgi:hypothetical protein
VAHVVENSIAWPLWGAFCLQPPTCLRLGPSPLWLTSGTVEEKSKPIVSSGDVLEASVGAHGKKKSRSHLR